MTHVSRKTEETIKQEIRDAQNVLKKLENDLKQRVSMEPAQRLALDIHSVVCNGISTGHCDWGNRASWDFKGGEMNRYLGKAEKMLAVSTHEQAMEIITISHS